MTNDTEQAILSRLDKIDSNIELLKADISEMKADNKIIKDDMNELKTSQAVLTNDSGWIKVLFGGGISIIIVLLGVVINTIFRLLALLG